MKKCEICGKDLDPKVTNSLTVNVIGPDGSVVKEVSSAVCQECYGTPEKWGPKLIELNNKV